MEGYEKYASRIQELLFDGMDVHEVWVYMKVMLQIEKNEICFRAYLERSGLIWFAEAGSRRQVQIPDLLETKRKLEMNRTKISKPLCKYPDCFRCVYPDCTCNEGLTKKGNDELVRDDHFADLADHEPTENAKKWMQRGAYSVEDCLRKWGVDTKGSVASGQENTD